MNGWDGNADGDRALLGRIVALLFALAGLADLAATLPALRRREVLAILGFGEAAAWSLLTGMATEASSGRDAPADAPLPADAPGECRDALLLAARFRLLALILAALVAPGAFAAPRRVAVPHADEPEPARSACRQATSPAPDSS